METVGWDGQPKPAGQRAAAVGTGQWPATVLAVSDTFCGHPFQGPLG